MMANSGQMLYVGRELDRHAAGCGWEKQSSEVVPVEVTERVAAQMFLPNLANWRDRPFVRQHYTTAELDRLHDELQRLVDEDSRACSISFGLRRMVLVRSGNVD